MEKEKLKNVKIKGRIHSQIKEMSVNTGINVGKLVEMGVLKIIEEFKEGGFDKLISVQKKIRHDGTIVR